MYEGSNIIESRGIIHPETREVLTVGQAISMRILDVRTGRIVTSIDSRQSVPIEQAAQDGLIDSNLAARLVGPCGTTEDGKEVTLLEAIQRELYDAEQGFSDPAEKRIKVISETRQIPGQGMSIAEAMNVGQVDLQKGMFRLPDGTYITVSEAYERGYLIYNEIIKIKSSAVSLSDAILQGLVEEDSGWIVDRNSGDKFQLDVAIKNQLIDPEVREVVDPSADRKITLTEAVQKGIVNPKFGRFVNNVTKEKLRFSEAQTRRLICKPMTLKDVVDNSLMDNNGLISSPLKKYKLNILEAISYGVLDSDNVKSVTNTKTGELLSLSEALASRIILPDITRYRDALTSEICTIPEAVDRGLITSVSQKSLFDIDGFRDPGTNEFLSFNRALNKGLISSQNGGSIIVSVKPTKLILMDEGVKLGSIRPEVYEMLNRKVGIFQNSVELTVMDAVFRGVLNPHTGYLLDPQTQKPLPLDKAVEVNLITPEGAVLLNSLLNITLTTQTVTKTVKRYVTMTNTVGARTDTIITFTEAVRRGLIDEHTQTFTDPTSGTIIPIQQALDEGLLGYDMQEGKPGEVSPLSPSYKAVSSRKNSAPGQYVELKITKKSFVKDPTPPIVGSSPVSKIQTDSVFRPDPITLQKSIEKMYSRPGSEDRMDVAESHSTIHTSTTTSKTSTASFISSERRSMEKQVFELPPDGWYLAEAINQKLFDPVTGLFIIPGTDRLVSFEECVKLKIINPKSAVVIDPKNGREITLIRSIEKGILNGTGQYKKVGKYIPMKEAIENNLVLLGDRQDKDSPSQRLIQITKVTGQPDVIEVSSVLDNNPPVFTQIESSGVDIPAPEPIQLAPGIIYDPATALVLFTKTGHSENIIAAVRDGTVDPSAVKVKDPTTGKEITVKEALKRGIIDGNTGDYIDKSGRKISIVDAAKFGVLAVLGAPLIAGAKAIQVIRNTMVVDPKTGEKIPMEVAYERGLVDEESLKKYEQSSRDSPQRVTSTTMEYLDSELIITDPVTGKQMTAKQAVDSGSIKPEELEEFLNSERTATVKVVRKMFVTDPITKQQIPLDDALSQGLIDNEMMETMVSQQHGVITENVYPQSTIKTSTESISKSILVKDPNTGNEVNLQQAVERGLVTPEYAQQLLDSVDSNKKVGTITTTYVDSPKMISEAELTRSRITTEPKFKVTIGSARSFDLSPEKAGKPVILQKMRKKVVSPKEAVEKGMIDDETAEILNKKDNFLSPTGERITLSEAVLNKTVDGDKGAIVDPQRGDVMNINEAIERGVLDPDGTNQILIPLAQSLSVPRLAEQGLIEPETCKIIHPETGDHLSLREAIVCDIVDPLSTMVSPDGQKVTLQQAIVKGNVDENKSLVKTRSGNLDLLSAVGVNVFDKDADGKSPIENIPPAGMTLTVAVQRGLVDANAKHVIHPITGVKTPIEDAIKGNFIMAIPFPVSRDAVQIKDALEDNLIDSDKGTFTNPKTGEVVPISQAIEQGLLIVKPLDQLVSFETTGGVTSVTETVTSHHTITTKMIEILSGYVLVSSNEVQESETGKIISIEEARERGIIKDEQTSKKHFTTKEVKVNFDDAVKQGLVDMETGTFSNPETGTSMTITEAISKGILDTSIESTVAIEQYSELVEINTEYMTLIEAFETIYDETTSKFRDPKNPKKSYTFKEALERNIIDPESVVYDVQSGKQVTLKDALKKGLIDPKSGKVKDKTTGKSVDIKKAAAMGILAVVASPVLAGMAIAKGIKSLTKKSPSKEDVFKVPTVKPVLPSKREEVVPVVPARKPKTPKDEAKEVSKLERPLSDAIESVNIMEEMLVSSSITVSAQDPKYIKDTKEKKSVKDGKSPKDDVEIDFLDRVESDDRISPIREKSPVIEQPSGKSSVEQLGTESEIVYERLPLGDAISQRKIEPKVCRILVDGQESILTIQDALDQGEISPLDLVDIVSKNCISIVTDKPKSISFNELSPEVLAQYGFYDPERQIFLDPRTGAKISFIDMIYSVYDPTNLFVQDLNAKTEQFYPLEEAIAIPLIDKNTGHMVDPKSGKRVSFFDCIYRGWIVEGHPNEMAVTEPVTFESALDSGAFDKIAAEYKDPNTGETHSFAEAIRLNLIDPDSICLKNPTNNEIITLTEAIELGFVDLYHGVIIDVQTKRQIELKIAFLNGILSPSSRRPVSLEAVIKMNLYDPSTGKIKDLTTDQKVTIDEAVERSILHATISEVKDTRADSFVTLEDALTTKLVNSETGKLRDTKEGSLITLDVAYQRGYVITKQLRWSMVDIIEKGYYYSKTGKILDPRSGSEVKIKEAITSKLVEVDSVKIRDDQQDKLVTLTDAIKVGLLNDDTGIITNPVMTLDVANEKGYLLSDKKPWSLQEGLVQGCYDPDTGLLTIDSATKTLEDAIKKGEIDPDVLTIKNSKTGELISLGDAIKAGIIDSKLGKAKDPLRGEEMSFVDASERGLIIPAKRKFSLPEAVFKGFYDPKTGKFTHPESREKVATDRALKKGMLDPQSTLVNVDGKVLPFEFAVDRGIVDVRTGSVVLGIGEKIDFQEAFERGVLIEVRKPMSLSEAVSKGVYDERTGLFMDPNTGKKYHLAEAIKMNLIDPDSVHVKDIRSGSWKKISLPESLETGVVDSKTGTVKDINKDNNELTIKEAFEIGLLVDSKASISLQRAIHQGLYDDKTGKIADPVSSRKITIHEAIRKFIINPKYLCYFDKKSEKPLTLAEACRTGVVDRRTGMFTEPSSDVSITLNRAMELGLIVDIEGAGFSLYDALAMGFYDVDKSKFKHPVTDRPLTLKESIAEDLISPETSLIKNIQASKYVKLPEAIKHKLIDENLGCYNLPNGNSINLLEAKLRGLIVTSSKNISIEEAVKNGLFRPDTGKFVDPTSGDFLDLNAAIMSGLIDPDTTALKDPLTNKLKSLVAAIENGDIDVTKGRVLDSKMKRAYNLDVALDKGHLVTILKPITSSRGFRRSSVDYTRDKEPILREFTLDEALRFEFIDPNTAVVKDPQTGKFRLLRVAIEEGTVDLNSKAAFDPQSGRSKSVCVIFENGLIVYYHEPLTFEQAIDMKLLDVQTARFTHPRTNEVLSVKDAAILGHVDSDSALIKDNLKKKLVKLPEAFRKGLMDAEKGNILDTETSKLHPLPVAIESGLLITPKRSFTLNECLEFGIYNPTTGGFSDPFITTSVIDRKRLTLTDCIEQGIVDPSSTVVKDPENGHIVPLQQAITAKLVDPIGGRLVVDASKETTIDLVKAQAKGYILAAETRVSPQTVLICFLAICSAHFYTSTAFSYYSIFLLHCITIPTHLGPLPFYLN